MIAPRSGRLVPTLLEPLHHTLAKPLAEVATPATRFSTGRAVPVASRVRGCGDDQAVLYRRCSSDCTTPRRRAVGRVHCAPPDPWVAPSHRSAACSGLRDPSQRRRSALALPKRPNQSPHIDATRRTRQSRPRTGDATRRRLRARAQDRHPLAVPLPCEEALATRNPVRHPVRHGCAPPLRPPTPSPSPDAPKPTPSRHTACARETERERERDPSHIHVTTDGTTPNPAKPAAFPVVWPPAGMRHAPQGNAIPRPAERARGEGRGG